MRDTPWLRERGIHAVSPVMPVTGLTAPEDEMLCRGRVSAGTLRRTAPRVRVEDSPSPVYGAALLMRLGFTALRGSNPRSSALTSSFARKCRSG